MAEPLTVDEFCRVLAPDLWARYGPASSDGTAGEMPPWPPDVFAIAAALLNRTGAYVRAIEPGWWPPVDVLPLADPTEVDQHPPSELDRWLDYLLGREGQPDYGLAELWWQAATRDEQPPEQLRKWWAVLRTHAVTPLSRLSQVRPLVVALLALMTVADEACYGITDRSIIDDSVFEQAAAGLLDDPADGATLCRDVHPSRVRVLPKCRTPRNGLTIRSFSHHLALCGGGEVVPRWQASYTAATAVTVDEPAGGQLNLLLVPWPAEVQANWFRRSQVAGHFDGRTATGYGYFDYTGPTGVDPVRTADRLLGLVEVAEKTVGPVHMVVIPELGLTKEEYDLAEQRLTKQRRTILVSGILTPPGGNRLAGNQVALSFPLVGGEASGRMTQRKHHRWMLDRSQIVNYGLGGNLSPEMQWWEASDITERELNFVQFNNWLTTCPLICEDLARSDPVGDMIRAVGPNLVIALLMDGPQLPDRWPGKYATVLADDPGSSVLTLTCLGMTLRSRPPGRTSSRIVALWKEPGGESVPIELPSGDDAVVLSLAQRPMDEYTADGRPDMRRYGAPCRAGCNYIRSPSS